MFKNWGFDTDDNGKWVLNFDPSEVVERYSYHVPDVKRILSRELTKKVVGLKRFGYKAHFTSSIRKNILDRINAKKKGKIFIQFQGKRFIELLKETDIDFEELHRIYIYISQLGRTEAERRYPDLIKRYEDVNALYIMAKFMIEDTFDNIGEQMPELREKCERLRELVSSKNLERSEGTVDLNYRTEIGKNNGTTIHQDGTIIIDGDLQYGVKSACEALTKLGIMVSNKGIHSIEEVEGIIQDIKADELLEMMGIMTSEKDTIKQGERFYGEDE